MRCVLRLGLVLALVACHRGQAPPKSPLQNATEPAVAPSVLGATETSMMRICNDTQHDIESVVYYNDYTAGDLRAGECGQYWDMDGVADSTNVKFFVGSVKFTRDFDDVTTGLAPGYWTYHVTIDDFAKRKVSTRVMADHPEVLTRVCNGTGEDVDDLVWYETFTEDTMSPGECTPYRPAFVASGYADGTFRLGSDGAARTLSNTFGAAALTPGRWTFHLEIADSKIYAAVLRRSPNPD